MPAQPGLFDDVPGLPDGLRLQPAILGVGEEAELIGALAGLPFAPFQFRGFEGRRRVASFGWGYDFERSRLQAAEPLPDFLKVLRSRAAALLGVDAARLAQTLVTEYAPGAAIGWHRDRPEFGAVVGVSLGAPCTFRLRRKQDAGWERRSFVAEPRAAYTLEGPARSDWKHSISAVEAVIPWGRARKRPGGGGAALIADVQAFGSGRSSGKRLGILQLFKTLLV